MNPVLPGVRVRVRSEFPSAAAAVNSSLQQQCARNRSVASHTNKFPSSSVWLGSSIGSHEDGATTQEGLWRGFKEKNETKLRPNCVSRIAVEKRNNKVNCRLVQNAGIKVDLRFVHASLDLKVNLLL